MINAVASVEIAVERGISVAAASAEVFWRVRVAGVIGLATGWTT